MELPIFQLNIKTLDAHTMGASFSGSSVDLAEVDNYAVHIIWTGAPVGNLQVEASNDNSNFVAVDTTAAGGGAGQRIYNVAGAGYRYVRVSYTFTSGSGTVTAYISGKL